MIPSSQKCAHLLALRIADCLVNTQDEAGGFRRAANRINFHQTRLPDKSLHVIADTSGAIDINAEPFAIGGVLHTQLVQDIS